MKTIFLILFIATSLPAFSQTNTNSSTAPASQSVSLTQYAGTYLFSDGMPISKFVVLEKDGGIYGEADSYGSFKLEKQAEVDTYKSTSSYGSIIVFNRDATTKAITSLTLKVQGQEIVAKKESK